MKLEELRSRIVDMYYKESLPTTEICSALALSRGTFYNLMSKFNLPLKETKTGPVLLAPPCPQCGNRSSVILTTKGSPSSLIRRRKCKKCGCLFFTKEEVIDGKRISTH